MPPLPILIGAAVLAFLFLAPRRAAPTAAARQPIGEPEEEGGGFADLLRQAGQYVSLGATAIGLGSKVVTGLSGVFADAGAAPAAGTGAAVAPAVTAPEIAPTIGVAATPVIGATLPTFAIADIAAVELGFELGAGVVEVGTSASAVAGGGTTGAAAAGAEAGAMATGTVAGALGFIVAPIAIAFVFFSLDKMLTEKRQLERRTRRVEDAQAFITDIISKIQGVTTDQDLIVALGQPVLPGRIDITVGEALATGASFWQSGWIWAYIDREPWHPRYQAIIDMLGELGHRPKEIINLRDVDKVSEAITTEIDHGFGPAIINTWRATLEAVDSVLESAFGDQYRMLRDEAEPTDIYHPPEFLPPLIRMWWYRSLFEFGATPSYFDNHPAVLNSVPYPETWPGYHWVTGWVRGSEVWGGDNMSGYQTGRTAHFNPDPWPGEYIVDPPTLLWGDPGPFAELRQLVPIGRQFNYIAPPAP